MDNTLPRPRGYAHDGQVDWPRLAPWAGGLLLASLAFGWLLNLAYRGDFYSVVILPLGMSYALAGLVFFTVRQGHCRNQWVGGALGLMAGLVFFIGHYFFGLLNEVGVADKFSPARFGQYLQRRMETDHNGKSSIFAIKDGSRRDILSTPDIPGVNADRTGTRFVMNLAFAVFELCLVLNFTVRFGILRSRKPYCARCREWKLQQLAFFAGGLEARLAELLPARQLQRLKDWPPVQPKMDKPYTALAVDYCPASRSKAGACPAYFSIKAVKRLGHVGAGQFSQFEAASGEMTVPRVELDRGELAALVEKFPALDAELAGAGTVGGPPPLPGTEEAGPAVLPGASVEVQPLPPGIAGTILTPRNILIGNMVSLISTIALFAGLITSIMNLDGKTTASHVLLGVGLALLAAGLVVGVFLYPGRLSNQRLLGLTRRALRARPDKWVDPDDPRAIFVEIVPRRNWGRVMADTASDVGILLIDPERGEIVYEGDNERFRIPARALISCTVEKSVVGAEGQSGSVQYLTVIRASHPSILWEAPLIYRWLRWRLKKEDKAAGAEEMRRLILSVMPQPPPLPQAVRN